LRSRTDASRRMIDLFTGSAVVVVIFAFAQKHGIYAIAGAPFYPEHPSSFFGYYTNYAGYAAMAATLATGELLVALTARRWTRACKYGGALAFILVGVAISTSRGGLLALAVGWATLVILNVRRGSIAARAVVILVTFAAVGYLATPSGTLTALKHRLSTPLGTQSEDKTRFALEHAGSTALGQHPLGLGYANFPYYLRENVHVGAIQQVFAHAQNTPIQIGLDAGWIGLAGFAVFFLWPIGMVIKRSGASIATASRIRASAFGAALVGFLAQGLYDYLFYEVAFEIFIVTLVWGTIHALSQDKAVRSPPAVQSSALSLDGFSSGTPIFGAQRAAPRR
jgi:O-antigen ligase